MRAPIDWIMYSMTWQPGATQQQLWSSVLACHCAVAPHARQPQCTTTTPRHLRAPAGQLLNNRAACNLKLGNVRAVLRDTATAVHLVTCMRLIPELGLLPHHRTLLRSSRTAQDVYVKAKVRRARAFELAGNSAAAAEIFTELVVGYQGSVPDDVHASYRAYLGHVLPSASLLAKDAYDWSLMYAGKWTQRQASGALPAVIRDFAAAHHAGHVYVVGGVCYQRGSMVPQYSSEVAALDLRTWAWRRVGFKGQGVSAGHLPGLCLPSTAVWRDHVVCFLGGPVVYLFDMAAESWSRKGAGGWPRWVAGPGLLRAVLLPCWPGQVHTPPVCMYLHEAPRRAAHLLSTAAGPTAAASLACRGPSGACTAAHHAGTNCSTQLP